jgi:hypothetical protein
MFASGLTSMGALLESNEQFSNLAAARPPRCRLTSSYAGPNDFTLEVVGEQMPAPARVDEVTVKLMRGWLRSRQVISGVISGDNLLEDISKEAATAMLAAAGILKPRDRKSLGAPVWEHAVPHCLFRQALEFLQKVGPGLPAAWDVVEMVEDEDGTQMGVTKADLEDLIQKIKAVETIVTNLPKMAGPFIPLGAATPRPSLDTSDIQRNTRWVPLSRWGGTTAYKLRIEVRNGRMTAMSAVPELEGGTREAPEVVQKARNPDRHGRPQLTPLPSLPPLAEDCRFLTDTFARREDILQAAPEFAKWAGAAGLPLFLLQQINLTKTGKAWLTDVMDQQQQAKEDLAAAREEAAAAVAVAMGQREAEVGNDISILAAAIEAAPVADEVEAPEMTEAAPVADEVEAPETIEAAPVADEVEAPVEEAAAL